jgi:hypothetical protein
MENKIPFRVKMESLQQTSPIYSSKYYFGRPTSTTPYSLGGYPSSSPLTNDSYLERAAAYPSICKRNSGALCPADLRAQYALSPFLAEFWRRLPTSPLSLQDEEASSSASSELSSVSPCQPINLDMKSSRRRTSVSTQEERCRSPLRRPRATKVKPSPLSIESMMSTVSRPRSQLSASSLHTPVVALPSPHHLPAFSAKTPLGPLHFWSSLSPLTGSLSPCCATSPHFQFPNSLHQFSPQTPISMPPPQLLFPSSPSEAPLALISPTKHSASISVMP